MKKQIAEIVAQISEKLDIAENILLYCETKMDEEGARDIPDSLSEMYANALAEQRAYMYCRKLVLTLIEEKEEREEILLEWKKYLKN